MLQTLGLGAILSQRNLKDKKVHPVLFFSRKLSVNERNYDVSNPELLVVLLCFRSGNICWLLLITKFSLALTPKTDSSLQTLYTPTSSSGDISPSWLAIQGLTGCSSSCNNVFGGLRCHRILKSLSLLVQSAAEESPPTVIP